MTTDIRTDPSDFRKNNALVRATDISLEYNRCSQPRNMWRPQNWRLCKFQKTNDNMILIQPYSKYNYAKYFKKFIWC